MLYNVLDFPAGTLPVGRVTSDDEAQALKYPSSNPFSAAVRNVRYSPVSATNFNSEC